MDLKKVIASLSIKKISSTHSQVEITMPVWFRPITSEKVLVNLPLLGIEIYAKNTEEDKNKAIEEAITVFVRNAQDFGQGLQSELVSIGWQVKKNKIRYRVPQNSSSTHAARVSEYAFPKEQNNMLNSFIPTSVNKRLSVSI